MSKRIELILILVLSGIALLTFGCKHESPITKVAWLEKPVSQWPGFVLTNEIGFENQPGLGTIDLGSNYKYWKFYPKNDRGNYIFAKRLINKDSQEIIGQFNTLKVRDWIVFEIDKRDLDL